MTHPPERDESWIERLIREAMEGGAFDRLAGSGEPLQLDDDSHVPPDVRMAHKLLRDNDLAPEWITLGKELEAQQAAILKALRRAAHVYRRAYRNHDQAEARWQAALAKFRGDAERYNRKVLNYNLKVPPGINHRRQLVIEREIQRALAGNNGA
jgi:hypothetical protein